MVNHIPINVDNCGLCGEVFVPTNESIVAWTRNSPLISYHYMVCSKCRSYTLDRDMPRNKLGRYDKTSVTVALADSFTAVIYKGSWKHLDPDVVSLVPSRYFMSKLYTKHKLKHVKDVGEGTVCLKSEHIEKYNNTLFWPYSMSRFFSTRMYKLERQQAEFSQLHNSSDSAIFIYA